MQKSRHKALIKSLNLEKIKNSKKNNKNNNSKKSVSGGKRKNLEQKKKKVRNQFQKEYLKKHKNVKKHTRKHTKKQIRGKMYKETLLYFYYDGCPYCDEFSPEWEKLSKKLKHMINFKKIDKNDYNNNKLIQKYNIRFYPTILIERTGKVFELDRTKENIKTFISENSY